MGVTGMVAEVVKVESELGEVRRALETMEVGAKSSAKDAEREAARQQVHAQHFTPLITPQQQPKVLRDTLHCQRSISRLHRAAWRAS